MCLDRLTKINDPVTDEVVTAWGIFAAWHSPSSNKLQYSYPYYGYRTAEGVKFDTWLEAEDTYALRAFSDPHLLTDDGSRYPCGFHKYANRKEAKQAFQLWQFNDDVVLLKVKLRRVLCLGRQDGYDVLVAQQIYIPTPRPWWQFWRR